MVTGDDKYREEIILDSTEGDADAVRAIMVLLLSLSVLQFL